MPRAEDSVQIRMPLSEAFSYFAEFANIAEWDPGVVTASKRSLGALALGDVYDVVSLFAGRPVAIVYEVTLLEAPNRICLRGHSKSGQTDDEIRFETVDLETRITWRLDFAPKGLLPNLARPILGLLLRRLARETMDGIRQASQA